MECGLSRENISNIRRVLRKFKEVQEAVLYGSRAKGNYKSGSDIDIALKGEQLNLRLLNKIDLDLDELFLPYTFDISIYDHISNKDLVAHIQRVGKILYQKNSVQQDHK